MRGEYMSRGCSPAPWPVPRLVTGLPMCAIWFADQFDGSYREPTLPPLGALVARSSGPGRKQRQLHMAPFVNVHPCTNTGLS